VIVIVSLLVEVVDGEIQDVIVKLYLVMNIEEQQLSAKHM
jgi:metal-sulfur cluster biosynthetic enzyme